MSNTYFLDTSLCSQLIQYSDSTEHNTSEEFLFIH